MSMSRKRNPPGRPELGLYFGAASGLVLSVLYLLAAALDSAVHASASLQDHAAERFVRTFALGAALGVPLATVLGGVFGLGIGALLSLLGQRFTLPGAAGTGCAISVPVALLFAQHGPTLPTEPWSVAPLVLFALGGPITGVAVWLRSSRT